MFNNMEDGIIIQSWVGDGVSPLTAIPFKIETLDAYINFLQHNHERQAPDNEEMKVDIARFFNDPKANVENPNPSNVFIKDKRQYYIFFMNQNVLSSFIPQIATPDSSDYAIEPVSGMESDLGMKSDLGMDMNIGGSLTRRKRRTKSSRKRTKRRRTKRRTKSSIKRKRRTKRTTKNVN